MELMNPNTLATFRELMEPDELREFLERVQQEMLRAHAQMQAAHAAEDWHALQKLAHRLKGSLGSVGCDALFTALNQLDTQLQASPIRPPAPAQMAGLSAVVASTAQRLLQP